MKYKNIAVVFAGGVGSRMNHPDGPKQFIAIDGKPIIIHTLDKFESNTNIDAIYVSCLEEKIEILNNMLHEHGISKVRAVVPGGKSAQESIYRALCAADEDVDTAADAVVSIHDGVRPLISSSLIDRNIASVIETGSAVSSIPAFETVARSINGGETVNDVENRDHMYTLQAPQSFRLNDIISVHRKSIEDGLMGTFVDQAHMMSYYGRELHMVEGLRGNIKITIPGDVAYFKFLIESGEISNVIT